MKTVAKTAKARPTAAVRGRAVAAAPKRKAVAKVQPRKAVAKVQPSKAAKTSKKGGRK
jgi:hypothetical protein